MLKSLDQSAIGATSAEQPYHVANTKDGVGVVILHKVLLIVISKVDQSLAMSASILDHQVKLQGLVKQQQDVREGFRECRPRVTSTKCGSSRTVHLAHPEAFAFKPRSENPHEKFHRVPNSARRR